LFIALTYLFAASSGFAQTPPKVISVPVHNATEEDAIREAVFRHRLAAGKYLSAYLSINGKDPSEQFLARFAQSNVIVRGTSQLPPQKRLARYLFDPSTNENTIVFSADAIK